MSLILRSLLAFLLLCGAGLAVARVQEVTRTATGFGESPQAAVANALVEAARQGLGVSVALDPAFRRETFEWVSSQGALAGKWTSSPEARAATLANVSGYRVLSTREISEALWQAEVEAKLLAHEGIRGDRSMLPALVVAPVRTRAESYDTGETVPAARLREDLERALEQAFTASRRVRVLDRDYPAEVRREEATAAAGLSPLEHARLGQQLGAELLFTAEIEEFQLGREGDTFYGAKLHLMEPVVRIHYQLIETATREILDAGTWTDERSATVFLTRLREAGIEPDREPGRVDEVLLPDVARALAGEALQTLHPLRVVSARGPREIYVTRGAGTLDEGDLLSAQARLEELRDPDTGVAIRPEGPVVATLRVTDVKPGYARAELVTGELSALGADVVLHREVPVAEAPPVERPLTPGSSEAPLKW